MTEKIWSALQTVFFYICLLTVLATFWFKLNAQTAGLPRITEAYYREVQDTDESWAGVPLVRFNTRLLIVFKTDVPIPASFAYAIAVNQVDTTSATARFIGCGGSWGTAPTAIEGWYSIDCTSLPRAIMITDVYVSLISSKYQIKRAPDPPPAN